jgi:acyl-coenzyme A synthetase/AMP-(fatty) acid ligase
MRIYESNMQRKLFEPKAGRVTGRWKQLHSEKVNNFYSSPSIIRMIKSRK